MAKKYVAEPTAARFHNDLMSNIKGLMSAVGQGKTTACVIEMLQISSRQAPDEHGVRYTRWAIVRSSFSQLKSTTIRTFQEWIPVAECPIIYDSPIRGLINKMPLPDGTFMHAEFLFMSMDGPTSESDLLSLEITGGYIAEAAEFKNPSILKNLFRRTGRYPSKQTAPLTWSGCIMDYNPPARRSWLYNEFEVNKSANKALYKIPPPLIAVRDPDDPDDPYKVTFIQNPQGEGIEHQPKGIQYWMDIADQDRADWEKITRFVLGEYTHGISGKPVFPAFNRMRHCSAAPLPARRGALLLVGMDFGLTPAAVFCQYYDGRLNALSELTTEDMDIITFIETQLIPHVREHYPGMAIMVIGDPSGIGRSQIDKRTPFGVLQSFGIQFTVPRTNSWPLRKSAVNWFLGRRDMVQVDEVQCEALVAGMLGGYTLEEPKNQHATPTLVPVKNFYSHINDAFQYVCLYCRDGGELYSGLAGEDGFILGQPATRTSGHVIEEVPYIFV